MRRGILAMTMVSSLAVLSALPAAAQEVGVIAYIQGDVQLTRGEDVMSSQLFIGFPVNDLDQFRTGDDGQVSITTNAAGGVDATINVNPDTTFTLDMGDIDAPTANKLELMDGTVKLSVAKLTGTQSFSVDTLGAVMGIRGTVFDVSSIAGGDVLLTVDEGRVACTTEDGNTLYSQPGTIVEDVNDAWDDRPISPDQLTVFRQTWHNNRLAFLQSHADQELTRTASAYIARRDAFEQAYRSLMVDQAIVNGWIEQQRTGRYQQLQYLRERRQIAARLIEAHRRLVAFEHLYYIAQRLETASSQGVAFTQAGPNLTAAAFFQMVDQDRQTLPAQMRTVRAAVMIDRERYRRNPAR